MGNINSKLILNIEVKDPDLLTKLTTISMELSISLDQFILYSMEKMLYDIDYVRNMRTTNNT